MRYQTILDIVSHEFKLLKLSIFMDEIFTRNGFRVENISFVKTNVETFLLPAGEEYHIEYQVDEDGVIFSEVRMIFRAINVNNKFKVELEDIQVVYI